MTARRVLLALVILLTRPAAAETLQPRIVNGLLSFGDPTVGALLQGSDPTQAIEFCSGTLVGCRTFVTAAHCVCGSDGSACQSGPGAPNPADWLVFFQHGGFYGVDAIALPAGFSFPSDDVAVLTLSTPVTGIVPSPLVSQAPPVGTDATIVGFGRTGGNAQDYGLKQRGSVVTASCPADLPSGLLCWNFQAPLGPAGTDSNTCNGDSGGPLFVDAGGVPTLAGITSGGSSFDCLPTDQSYDTSVAVQRSFIEAHAADLGGASCGTLSQVGDGATQVLGFTQHLDATTTEGRHSFDVGAGVTQLRVAMNASEDAGADLDLYVRFGAPPTTTEWDCRAFGPNQWGFCQFDAPSQGTWYVLVNRYSGASTYQVTATLLAGQGSPPPPPPAERPQTRPQRRCLNGLADAAERVVRAQAEDAGACLRAFARGQVDQLGAPAQSRTAGACLTNDVTGRVEGALERTVRRDEERCTSRPVELPDFAYRGAGPVNSAAQGQTAALAADLFGADLDAALVPESGPAGAARCQEAVADRAGDVLDAGVRLAADAKRRALRGLGTASPVGSSVELETALLSAFARDRGGRLGRARARLERQVADACAGEPLATLFPGVCAGSASPDDLAACTDRVALCRLCRVQNAMDGLALDCDSFDDGAPDLTCP